MRQDIDDLKAVVDAAAGGDGDAEDVLLALIVLAFVEDETAAALGLRDGPAGEAARDFGDVLLGVAAIDAEGVEFHEFAAVVFVETLLLFLAGAEVRVGADRLPVVEIEEHGGALRGGEQKVFEFAEDAGADDVALVGSDHVSILPFVDIDVEVVEPEICEDFLKLTVAVDGAEKFAFDKILTYDLNGAGEDLNLAAEVERGGSVELLAGAVREGVKNFPLFRFGERFDDRDLLTRVTGFEDLPLFGADIERGKRHLRRHWSACRGGFFLLFLLVAGDGLLNHVAGFRVGGERLPAFGHGFDDLGRGVVADQSC